MFDAHNHFTNINSIQCSGKLLPQNLINSFNSDYIKESEIGLDRRYSSLISKELQIQYLNGFLKIAKDTHTPITLHCVQYTEEMINLLKNIKLEENTAIWHGFNGSKETAKEIVKLGILISIGPKYNKNIKELSNVCPTILLETDYEGNSEKEHENIICNHYERLSKEIDKPIELIEESAIYATEAFKNRITFR